MNKLLIPLIAATSVMMICYRSHADDDDHSLTVPQTQAQHDATIKEDAARWDEKERVRHGQEATVKQVSADEEILQTIRNWIQNYSKKMVAHSVDIKFGTPLDSGDSLVPTDVREKAAHGTKVYPVRWHGNAPCVFLAGTYRGGASQVNFVQDLYHYVDAFGEGMIMQEQLAVSEDSSGPFTAGTPVRFAMEH